MSHHTAGVYQTRANVLGLEPWIPFEYRRRVVSGRQHPQYMLHGQPPTSDDRLAAEYARHDQNTVQQVLIVQHSDSRARFVVIIRLWAWSRTQGCPVKASREVCRSGTQSADWRDRDAIGTTVGIAFARDDEKIRRLSHTTAIHDVAELEEGGGRFVDYLRGRTELDFDG